MIAKLFISPNLDLRTREIEKILTTEGLSKNHPDLIYFEEEEKLGVEQAKKIREHLSLKPYSAKGRGVAVISAQNFTTDAQNSLLKTLEEPPESAIILLGADSEKGLLPTILSRCEIRIISDKIREIGKSGDSDKFLKDIERLLGESIEKRFEYIEKLEEKDEFLKALVGYFHELILREANQSDVWFTKLLLQAEEWEKANVNIRAILEYLMLNLPLSSKP